jgi:hypothetical protein
MAIYEKVYRPKHFESGERNSIIAKFLSWIFICEKLIYNIYSVIQKNII